MKSAGSTRKLIAAGALVAAGVGIGAAVSVTGSASAAGDTGTTSSSSASSSTAVAGTPAPGGQAPDPTKSIRPDEHLLTGTTAEKVRAAALAKYPSATIQRVETDSDGVYEAHILTSDGKPVIVQVGKDFTVTGTQTGPTGGPMGAPGGDHRGTPPAGAPSGTPPTQG